MHISQAAIWVSETSSQIIPAIKNCHSCDLFYSDESTLDLKYALGLKVHLNIREVMMLFP